MAGWVPGTRNECSHGGTMGMVVWQDSYSLVAGLDPGTRNEYSHFGRTGIVMWHVWFLAPGMNAATVAGQLWSCATLGSGHQE
jgi:hypothetical protein